MSLSGELIRLYEHFRDFERAIEGMDMSIPEAKQLLIDNPILVAKLREISETMFMESLEQFVNDHNEGAFDVWWDGKEK